MILLFHGIEMREGLTLRLSPVSSPGFSVIEWIKKGKTPSVDLPFFVFDPTGIIFSSLV